MKKLIQDIKSYNFQPSDKLLLDTNIWFFIYGPQKPNDIRVKTYSQAFKQLITAKSSIYIDVLIISEFINRYARIRQSMLNNDLNFKEFRKTEAFKDIAIDIAADTKQILRHCSHSIKNHFELENLANLINGYEDGVSDFNDQILAEFCRIESLTLITHDNDFRHQNVPVLTANTKLLL